MVFLFGSSRPKALPDIIKLLSAALNNVIKEERVTPQLESDITYCLDQMADKSQDPKTWTQQILLSLSLDLYFTEAASLKLLMPDLRKRVSYDFTQALRYREPNVDPGHQAPVVKYIFNERPEILLVLCRGYDYNGPMTHRSEAAPIESANREHFALACGSILQECFKVDSLVAMILYHEPEQDRMTDWPGLKNVDPNKPASGIGIFWHFFKWISESSVAISNSAFEVFKMLLTEHKGLVSHFLNVNEEMFLHRYHTLLVGSNNYVVKRLAIKLLADILLDRVHYDFMMKYTDDPENLKRAMNLLRDDRRMIQYESFHIFKIFVAKPTKNERILKIMSMNAKKMVPFLQNFLADRGPGQFDDEKHYCMHVFQKMI